MENKRRKGLDVKKILVFVTRTFVLLCLLFEGALISCTKQQSSSSDDKSIKSGFQYSNGAPLPSDFCAYSSDTNKFDIDNVSLTFFYGGWFSPDINFELENGINIPEFDVYFGDSDHEPIYTIAHKNENYVSEKYRCRITSDESHLVIINFNYSEKITIPRSLFSEDQGVIRFCISGTDVNAENPKYHIISLIYINYDVANEIVVLSPWDGKRT